MAKLKQQMEARNSKNVPRPQHQKDISLPEYGEFGQVVRKPIRIPNWLLITGIVIVALGLLIYVPSWFVGGKELVESYVLHPDSNMIRVSNEYLQDHPDDDFDGDGLSNAYETQKGTDPRHVDTDRDGVNDYYELFVSETNPLSADNTLTSMVKSETVSANKNVNTPYKVNDVVLWPSDWASRAKGSVVKTVNGYRFSNFKGYAQFPAGYAYHVENGIHVPLNYLQEEKAYEITGDYEVLLYNSILPVQYEISIFNNKYYLQDEGVTGILGKILEIILPSRSPLIACKHITNEDLQEDSTILVQYQPAWLDKTFPESRFGRNMNELTDLAQVYAHLNQGDCCLVSFFIVNEGEVVAEIYGYNSNGGLLLADPDTLHPIGVLNITERVSRIVSSDGTIIRREWFSFSGIGIDSTKKATRIAFFNYGASPDVEQSEELPVEETPVPTEEPTPEPTVEPTPEPTLAPTPAPTAEPTAESSQETQEGAMNGDTENEEQSPPANE